MLSTMANQCMEQLMFCHCQYELICGVLAVYLTWAKVGMTSYGPVGITAQQNGYIVQL